MKQHIAISDIVALRNYRQKTMKLKTFRFNPIQVNTYVVSDDTKQALIIDPGNCNIKEDAELLNYIEQEQLKPVAVVNTHPHIDHIMGNQFCLDSFHCPLLMHEKAMAIYNKAHIYAAAFGLASVECPEPTRLLQDSDIVSYGNQKMKVLYTPGHADGSICLYDESNKVVFVGDVLFAGSVGRTDLPTGSAPILIQSIREKLLVLPDNTNVFCGHEISTTIEQEKLNNPYLS